MALPNLSVGQVRAIGASLERDMSDVLLPRGSGAARFLEGVCSSGAQACSGMSAHGLIYPHKQTITPLQWKRLKCAYPTEYSSLSQS